MFMRNSVPLRDRAANRPHPRIARNLLRYYRNNTKEVYAALFSTRFNGDNRHSDEQPAPSHDILCGTIRGIVESLEIAVNLPCT